MTELTDRPAVVWRAKLRSGLRRVDHKQQMEHCVGNGLVGIGWCVPNLETGADLSTVVGYWNDPPISDHHAAQTIRRFAEEARIGDFVWTRDTESRYLLGRITGDYYYDGSASAAAVDVHQVRSAEWVGRLNELEVPGGVVRQFAGRGSSFTRIPDSGTRQLTPYLWAKAHNQPLPRLSASPDVVLTQLLDPYDVEDLVYVYLQVRHRYLVFPLTRHATTPVYEWSMIHRDTGRLAVVQVKTGGVSVDLDAVAHAAASNSTTIFAYATGGRYDGSRTPEVTVITDDELLGFVADCPQLLPPRIRTWFALATEIEVTPRHEGDQLATR